MRIILSLIVRDAPRAAPESMTVRRLPPALAIAERDGASGRDLLVAVAAGLETTTRVGLGTKYAAFRAKGWHSPGGIGLVEKKTGKHKWEGRTAGDAPDIDTLISLHGNSVDVGSVARARVTGFNVYDLI